MDANILINHPLTLLLFIQCLIAIIFSIVGVFQKAEIIISPIKGFMFGSLVHNETFTEDEIEFTEYTLQVLFVLFSINVLWKEKTG